MADFTPGPAWACKIGTRQSVDIRAGADLPMRRAVEEAFHRVTGIEAEFNFSGWSASLTEAELAVVENRLPSEQHYRDECIRAAAPDLYGDGQFLLDRLSEFERELADDHVAREFMGHVAPAIARFRAALAKAGGE